MVELFERTYGWSSLSGLEPLCTKSCRFWLEAQKKFQSAGSSLGKVNRVNAQRSRQANPLTVVLLWTTQQLEPQHASRGIKAR